MEEAKKPFYRYCLVPKCKNSNRNTDDKVFFSVPRDAKTRKLWCKVMRRCEVSPNTSLYCCEDHFNVEEDTANYIQYKIMKQQGQKVTLRLKEGVVPHIFQCQKRNMPPPVERMSSIKRQRLALVNEAIANLAGKSTNMPPLVERMSSIKRQRLALVNEAITTKARKSSGVSKNCDSPQTSHHEAEHSTSHIDLCDTSHSKVCDKAVQVNIKTKHRSKCVNVNLSIEKKNVALSPLRPSSKNIATSPMKLTLTAVLKHRDSLAVSSISSALSKDNVPCSSSELGCVQDYSEDEKHFKNVMRSGMLTAIEKEPKLLLGLPKQSYHFVKLLSENIPLPIIDILITLKKIKLNESFSILALQFGYAQSTISRIFNKSIPLIAAKMKELVVWPTPSEIYKNLPILFRDRYANVVSIINCLEIEIEKPSDADHQSPTWSQYKQCYTLKYLISFTPDGLVNFISHGYGGRATDVRIVQNCGYLECLPPNTAVMVDRRFKDLSPLLKAKKCTLIRPPSVLKSSSSTEAEVKQAQQIKALGIHVERVINRLREFHMLLPHACVEHNLIPIMDEVIIIACGLISLQDDIIKK